MIFSVFVLFAALCIQSNVVYSQQPQQQFGNGYPGMGQNPYSWESPYQAAATNSWMDYVKKAQEVSNQLYKQWDKTGAGNMFALGMQYAQQAAKEFGKVPSTAAETSKQAMQSIPFF